MHFRKIEGLQDVYPEPIEGTNEWYCCKLAKSSFCDLFEAEEIIEKTGKYEGMNCALIHFPEGTVYQPFEHRENVYVEHPIYLEGVLYFLVVDFWERTIKIMSWKLENQEAFVVAEISLDEVKDCYNLRLVVEPLTVVRQGHEGDLEIIWPEKKTIEERRNEALILRCEDKFYFSRWEEHPEYHEMVIVRDLETGYEVKRFDGQLQRMPNGEVWVL